MRYRIMAIEATGGTARSVADVTSRGAAEGIAAAMRAQRTKSIKKYAEVWIEEYGK